MATNEKVQVHMENGVTTMVHELKMNGYHLVDRKQRWSISEAPKTTMVIHSKFIDDRSYTVRETLKEGEDEPNQVIRTQMTQEQVKRFEEERINLWNPAMDSTFFGLTN